VHVGCGAFIVDACLYIVCVCACACLLINSNQESKNHPTSALRYCRHAALEMRHDQTMSLKKTERRSTMSLKKTFSHCYRDRDAGLCLYLSLERQ